MPAIILDLLKYVFLFILYLFVARAVRAIYLELRPSNYSAPPRKSAAVAPTRKTRKPPGHVVVVEGDAQKGKTFEIADELTIGRSDKCRIPLEDTYVSQMHARLFGRGERVMVEDLGSTNGTYVNGRRINAPAEVHRGDRIKIGKAVLELRK